MIITYLWAAAVLIYSWLLFRFLFNRDAIGAAAGLTGLTIAVTYLVINITEAR